MKRSFESLSAEFLLVVINCADNKLKSVVFSSPLSARSPDLCMLWHDQYREKHKTRLFFDLIVKSLYSCLVGVVKLLVEHKPFKYALYGKINHTLLVVASVCGSQTTNGVYQTPYVQTGMDDGIFVFGPDHTCGQAQQDIKALSFKSKVVFTFSLVKSGLVAAFKIRGSFFDRLLLGLQWFEWAISLKWLYAFYLEQALEQVVEKYHITQLGCIHEMHFYARVVWQVVAKYKIKGYTIQHAAITSGKRWYFCSPLELTNGLKLPDVMYVFNKDVIDLLSPYYSKTEFRLGCSYRYAFWKEVAVNPDKKGDYYLFAGALAGFDNDVLIGVLQKLVIELGGSVKIRLRLHPHALIARCKRKWLDAKVKEGCIEISKGSSLKDDIAGARVVIGMSTTVLEEALLLAVPVIQVTSHDYLQYISVEGIAGALQKDHRQIVPQDLVDIEGVKVDFMKMKERLGINQSIVTYSRLFS